MPEAIEVYLSAEAIRPLVINKVISDAYSTPNSRYGDSKIINKLGPEYKKFTESYPISVKDVKVKGKFMYWTFTDNWSMFCTFGMSGQWSPNVSKHPCFVFEFTDGSKVYFNDTRHFGTIKFSSNPKELNHKLNELGWDAFQTPYQEHKKIILSKLRSNKPIGQILMDQSVFAGVGNYIRAEALYLSKISPWRSSNSLSESEIDSLCNSIVHVMNESYKYQGATIQTYKTAYGEDGNFSNFFKVYGRKADPLGNSIITENTPEGRTIHWCPSIQQ